MPTLSLNRRNEDVLAEVGFSVAPIGSGETKLFLCKGLIDTGARDTLISANVVKALRPELRGLVTVGGVTGSGPGREYDMYVRFLNVAAGGGSGNHVDLEREIRVVQPLSGYVWDGFDALIGMDILSRGGLVINTMLGSCWLAL